MFRGSKRRAGRPGGRASAGGRNGASMSSPGTGTASRSITSSATRTGAPATAASARPYSALTVNGRVPVAVASPTRAVTVSQRSSGTSSLAGSMSTALTAVPAVRSSRAAVSSRPLATSASAAGRPSRLSSSLSPQTRSHSGTARWPAIVGQHDETLVQPPVGHVTPVRGPCGPVVARKNDADSRHGGPPADGGAAIRLTLVSVRRPATGYPPAAGPGQERPPEYCAGRGHTRVSAWRERVGLPPRRTHHDQPGQSLRRSDCAIHCLAARACLRHHPILGHHRRRRRLHLEHLPLVRAGHGGARQVRTAGPAHRRSQPRSPGS